MQKKTTGLAIASLVLAILVYAVAGQLTRLVGTLLGDLLAAILIAVPAVICGHLARAKIKKNRAHLRGGGMALAGLILGYLAVVAAVGQIFAISVARAVYGSKVSVTRSRMSTLASAIDFYRMNSGKFPPNLAFLLKKDGSPTWRGPYLKEEDELLDGWGTPFVIDPQNGHTYRILSPGPDKQVGTPDDIKSD